MKHNKIWFLLLLIIATVFSGCKNTNTSSSSEDGVNTYQTITTKEARDMMDKDNSLIILDVRTKEEYITGHIEGAILLPYTDITEQAKTVITDKTTKILVYCRSGRRSSIAANSLVELGYTEVYDFGGINDWTYGTVTD